MNGRLDEFTARVQAIIMSSIYNTKILELLGDGNDYPEIEITIKHKSEGKETDLLKKKKHTLMLKDYSSTLFNEIRKESNLKDDDYLNHLSKKDFKIVNINGKSGALVLKFGDDFFVVKSIQNAEGKLLSKILPDYLNYVKSNPNTLLCRMFGEHRVHFNSKDLRFLVMNNFLFSNNFKRVYDLKGSTVGRKAKENEDIFKDLDILEDQFMISIGASKKNDILLQIKEDCEFLEGLNIMDYSLLIGVQEKTSETQVKIPFFGFSKYQIFESSSGKEIYYIGIIDILTNWNFKKKAASTVKSIKNEKAQLSTISPKDYSKRLQGFITKLFK